MKRLNRIYGSLHRIIDDLLTTAASVVLSTTMFVFAILGADLHSLGHLIKEGVKAAWKKLKGIFKPKKTLAQEQQEYMQRQLEQVLTMMQEMMSEHIVNQTIAVSGQPQLTEISPMRHLRTTSVEPSIEPRDTLHVSARNVVPGMRATNGDITIVYTDAGSVEFEKKHTDEVKKPTSSHEEIDGWWEE